MKKIIILFCFIAGLQNVFAQINNSDILIQKLAAEKNEAKRIDLINDFVGNTAEIDPVSDLQNNQKILQYAKNKHDQIVEAMALTNIAYDYRAFGNTEKSFKYNLDAVSLATATGNEKLIANTTLNLAHNYKDQANYTKAIQMYKSVADIGAKLNDQLVQNWAFSSLGEIYIKLNKLDSALMYSQRAYEISVRHQYHDNLSFILQHLGATQGKMGNHSLAVGYFGMAIKEGYEMKSGRFVSESYTALAEYFRDIHQNDSGVLYAKKAIDAVKNTPFSNKSIKPAKLLLDIYENTNSDSAIKYFKIYKAANDSLFSAKTIQQTQIMSFESEMKQQELSVEKQNAEMQRRQNIQYALIAIGIIMLLTLYLLLSRSFITNTKLIEFFGVIALLIVFEFLNLLLHPFLERVTHHSPILMLLALVSIAALLVPLHHKVEKWATAKLVEKNKKIRLAVAKKTIEELEVNK